MGLGEGAVGVGVGEGGVERINQLTKYIHCQTTRTVSLQFVYFVSAAYCLI